MTPRAKADYVCITGISTLPRGLPYSCTDAQACAPALGLLKMCPQ